MQPHHPFGTTNRARRILRACCMLLVGCSQLSVRPAQCRRDGRAGVASTQRCYGGAIRGTGIGMRVAVVHDKEQGKRPLGYRPWTMQLAPPSRGNAHGRGTGSHV